MSRAATIGTLILIPALIVFLIYRHYMKDLNFASRYTVTSVNIDDFGFILKGWLKKILTSITWFFIIFMLLQYGSIFFSAISKYRGNKIVFTLSHIKNLGYKQITSFIRSVKYSFGAGIIGSIIGILISYFMKRKEVSGERFINFF